MSEHLLLAPLLESYFRRRLTKQRTHSAKAAGNQLSSALIVGKLAIGRQKVCFGVEKWV